MNAYTSGTITWEVVNAAENGTADDSIATIDTDGVVTGVASGDAYVIATCDGVSSSPYKVTVAAAGTEVLKTYDFTSEATVTSVSSGSDEYLSVNGDKFGYHSAQYGVETAAGEMYILKNLSTDTTDGKVITFTCELPYSGSVKIVNPENSTDIWDEGVEAPSSKGSFTLTYKGDKTTIGILWENKSYTTALSFYVK